MISEIGCKDFILWPQINHPWVGDCNCSTVCTCCEFNPRRFSQKRDGFNVCICLFTDVFSPNYKLTIGVDFSLKTLSWDSNTKINLQLWWVYYVCRDLHDLV